MNTQPFVSLIFLGDDKKFPLNKSNNIKCKQTVALQLPLLGNKISKSLHNYIKQGSNKKKVEERLCNGNLISKMHKPKLT